MLPTTVLGRTSIHCPKCQIKIYTGHKRLCNDLLMTVGRFTAAPQILDQKLVKLPSL